jgi:hypothetical protein
MLTVTVGAATPLSLSQTNVTLNVGQSQTITISGMGGNNLTSNSNPVSVSANINGNTLYVSGNTYGGSNLDICQSDGQCAMAYVFVSGTPPATTSSSTIEPTLSSLDISSSDIGNAFLGAESAITIAFTATAPITNPYVIIAGSKLTANGTGNGPYSVIYSASGNEAVPLLASINFSDTNGDNPAQINATLAGVSSTATVAAPGVTNTIPGCSTGAMYSSTTGASCTTTTTVVPVVASVPASSSSYKFLNPLNIGSVGVDVTELQERLTTEGLYSGPVTGYYGSLTQSAVEAFQAKVGLDQLGNVGPGTRAALNSGS